jgi:hypothetical protein
MRSRSTVIGLTLAADVVGSTLIVFVLPAAWSTRVILVAVWLAVTNAASRLYLRRTHGA